MKKKSTEREGERGGMSVWWVTFVVISCFEKEYFLLKWLKKQRKEKANSLFFSNKKNFIINSSFLGEATSLRVGQWHWRCSLRLLLLALLLLSLWCSGSRGALLPCIPRHDAGCSIHVPAVGGASRQLRIARPRRPPHTTPLRRTPSLWIAAASSWEWFETQYDRCGTPQQSTAGCTRFHSRHGPCRSRRTTAHGTPPAAAVAVDVCKLRAVRGRRQWIGTQTAECAVSSHTAAAWRHGWQIEGKVIAAVLCGCEAC